MFLPPNISRTFFEQEETVSMIVFVKQLSYRYLILFNSITLKSNLIVSGIQWLIKCPFCRENVFHPFSGLFISKSCLSPQIKLMINETKNTSANEWRFYEGCEKSPSAVILDFFSGTSSLRNKIHALQL